MINNHVSHYLEQVTAILNSLELTQIEQIVNVLQDARLFNRTIFLLGNGGSAATASHWANDLCKGASRPNSPRLRAMALTDNVPLMTAWANDTTYHNIFTEQLANFLKPDDVVIAISGSGNSANVIQAVEFARAQGAITVGLTGFAGGRLKNISDLCLIVQSDSMEQIEDVHLIITHIISTALGKLLE
jgi:D-sedoheptulose 7-phosphate isomerase